MLNVHYRQTKRRYQPEGQYCVEAELTLMDPRLSGLFYCEASPADQDEFKTVGKWREAFRLAIQRQKQKVEFFSTGGVGEQLPSAGRQVKRGNQIVKVLRELLNNTPDEDVEYCESNEIYTVDYFPDGDIDSEDDE